MFNTLAYSPSKEGAFCLPCAEGEPQFQPSPSPQELTEVNYGGGDTPHIGLALIQCHRQVVAQLDKEDLIQKFAS